MNLLEIRDIALGARRVLVEYAKLYPEDGIGPDVLDCGCHLGAWLLVKRLHRFGYKEAKFAVGTFEGDDHCWVELGLNIVDITATQFSGIDDPVWIVGISNDSYAVWKNGPEAIKHVNETWLDSPSFLVEGRLLLRMARKMLDGQKQKQAA